MSDEARMEQRHEHEAASERELPWMYCVAPGECTGAEHGNVTIIETCSCGAVRTTESNGGRYATLGWVEAAE